MAVVGIDTSVLLGLYQSRLTALGGSTTTTAKVAAKAPTAPWDVKSSAPRGEALVRQALGGRAFVDESALKLDVAANTLKGAADDYKRLFAAYQGLNTLANLAEKMDAKGLTDADRARIAKVFDKGMTEVVGYIDGLKLDKLRLTLGEAAAKLKSEVGARRDTAAYTTGVVATGGFAALPENLQGPIAFDVTIKRTGGDVTVRMDLDEMGATPRSLGEVISYMNGKLQDAGVMTRFSREKLPAETRTVTAGGKTVTLPDGPDRWALSLKGDLSETVSFQPAATAEAVYVVQSAGKTVEAKAATAASKAVEGVEPQAELLKFQTDQATGAPPAAVQAPGAANWVAGRVFSQSMGEAVAAARATATGPDGSVYVLADVDGAIDGQTLKGERDVALLKYDSAGQLVSSRLVGAGGEASGLALAVSADGKVAVAGSVTGRLAGVGADVATASAATLAAASTDGPVAGGVDSFVTVFDADGQELWTQRRAAREEDAATAVAFAPDGSVYVAGKARSAVPGASALGGMDAYLQGFSAKGQPTFVTQFGTSGTDAAAGLAVDSSGAVLVASTENGHAVLRRYQPPAAPGGAPTLLATRDLGDLQGGALSGMAIDNGRVILAGSTRNGALSAGQVTTAASGGKDGFVARLDVDLAADAADRLTYIGGSGDDAATALAVGRDGKVYVAGQAGAAAVAGMAPVTADSAARDGFLVRLDADTGAVEWSRRFSAKDGQAAPAAIAVDRQGASALDRLGLPTGTVDYTDSQRITAFTSARPGDQLLLRTSEGGKPVKVTLEANDTLQTLAAKINRALGFRGGKAEVVKDTVTTTSVDGKTTTETPGAYSRLQLTPLRQNSTVELMAGPEGRDLLAALGLDAGVVRATVTDKATGKTAEPEGMDKVMGLNLSRDLSLNTDGKNTAVAKALQDALTQVRSAYKHLADLGKPAAATAAASGPVPAYLSAQISNYQAALARLGG